MKTLTAISPNQVAEAESAFGRWWSVRFRQREVKALSEEAFRAGYIACLKTVTNEK